MHCETIASRSVLHGWELAPHRHERLHQVLLIQSGGGTARLDESIHALTPETLVNVPQGHVHSFRFKEGTSGWVVTLAEELLDEIFNRVGDIRADIHQPCVVPSNAALAQVMNYISAEYEARLKARAMVLKGLAGTLLGWVARAIDDATQANAANQEPPLLVRFRSLLQQHFAEQWKVSDYAAALAISPTHLSRIARATTGRSASRLIEARALREARRYLAYTNLSVSSIAYALGYTDPAYFTRVFLRDAGKSPRAFRLEMESNSPRSDAVQNQGAPQYSDIHEGDIRDGANKC